MDLYNIYDRDGYIVGNGGLTAEEAAKFVGVSLEEFQEVTRIEYRNHRNSINGWVIRKDRECEFAYKWTAEEKAEWAKVCRRFKKGV